MTLPKELLDRLDRLFEVLNIRRANIARFAFKEQMLRLEVEGLEQQHEQAYAQQPQDLQELSDWQSVSAWNEL